MIPGSKWKRTPYKKTRRPMRFKGGYMVVTVLIKQINYNKFEGRNQYE